MYSTLLFTATLRWPHHAIKQRIIGICIDIGVFSYGLHVTGPLSAPWYGVYLWVTLGNGFRYGENYLYLSCIVSLIGFGTVVATTDYWSANIELAIGLAITLLVIPAYSGVLIRRLNEARQRADAASRAKSDFLSCMSHEIRTPLNGILGMTDLLRLRPLESEDRECVETIHASGQTLARQINDILDLSKIEAGELSLEQIDFDLHALINTTLRIFHSQIESKQLQLQGNLDPGTPYQLSGDPHKLRQVIINLIGNAIKFTDQGFISVRVYPREFDEDKVLLRFEVADTGIGIPPERQKAIFEPFTQADSSVSRSYGGTGLGTTICKNIVELMGGEIGIQSTPGVGTTFWFDISFKVDQRYTRDNNQAWAGKCKVLYLHPDNKSQNSISAELRTWHIPFDTATTIEQASDLLQNRLSSTDAYDALVIDALPYSNEMENLLSRVKTGLLPGTTSVILIHAGHYPPEVTDHDRLYSLKAPVDKRILFNTLHACYSRRSTEDDII
ncbi:MAG: ATP-binding protein, partial [Pseudomonadota bacterium]|nr:ATP-binding protein [Pseudomonadota bacterium]